MPLLENEIMRNILFLLLLSGLFAACDANKPTVLNYNAEESVFYCAGIHSAALQYTKREQGIDIPTASLLEHVTHKLIQFTGARNSRVSELVIKGYDDMNNCAFNTIANSPEFNECMRIAHKCQDISEDFYKQFQN